MQKEKNIPIKTFRDLVAWQKGMEVAKAIYEGTKAMPSAERFGLTMQMRRCAVSTPSNIAEGYARQSRTEYVRFLKIARGSLAELETQLMLCEEMGFLRGLNATMNLLREADRVLQGLIRSLDK